MILKEGEHAIRVAECSRRNNNHFALASRWPRGLMLTCVIIIHIGLVQLKVLEHARNQEGGAALGSQVCSGTPETERRTKGKYVMESKKSICKAV